MAAKIGLELDRHGQATRLVILIKNVLLYGVGNVSFIILYGVENASFCTYFPTNLAYPFTLRVTGITRENAMVEYLDYRKIAPPTHDLNIWSCGRLAILKCATYRRYTDLSVMGVRVGVFKRYGR